MNKSKYVIVDCNSFVSVVLHFKKCFDNFSVVVVWVFHLKLWICFLLLKSINQLEMRPKCVRRQWSEIGQPGNKFFYMQETFLFVKSALLLSIDPVRPENASKTCQIECCSLFFWCNHKDMEYNGVAYACFSFRMNIKLRTHWHTHTHRHTLYVLCNRFWCWSLEMKQVRIWLTLWWCILWVVALFNDGPSMGVYQKHIIDRTFRYWDEKKKLKPQHCKFSILFREKKRNRIVGPFVVFFRVFFCCFSSHSWVKI